MAEPFSDLHEQGRSRSPAENVDTDQIVPARYLKVTDKDGLAEALFRDWRFEEDGSLKDPRFVLDQPEMAGPPDPARRRQLRRGLVARARPVGADRVGHPGHPLDLVRRHLPQQQPQERPAADRRRARASTRGCSSSSRERPGRRADGRPRAEVVLLPDDDDLPFDIDPFAKRMLLAGTDELGYLLGEGSRDRRPGRRPTRRAIDTLADAV